MKKIVLIGIIVLFATTGCTLSLKKKETGLTMDQVKEKTLNYINDNLMQPGRKAEIKEIVEEGGMYKIKVAIPDNQEIVSYVSKDGKNFFPQVMSMDEKKDAPAAEGGDAQAAAVAEVSKKTQRPKVEVFVMSHCPYGTQIEKGVIPVAEKLAGKIDFDIKFCDYAMHGEQEVYEQLNQFCINKTQPTKYLTYLKCFLEKGEGENCLKSTGIDVGKMKTCADATDKQFKVTELFKDKSTYVSGQFSQFNIFKDDSTKYGVQGSPTLVINGEKINAGRDSASLLKAVCSGFESQPEECKAELSSAAPTPGFGSGTAAAGQDAASCGN